MKCHKQPCLSSLASAPTLVLNRVPEELYLLAAPCKSWTAQRGWGVAPPGESSFCCAGGGSPLCRSPVSVKSVGIHSFSISHPTWEDNCQETLKDDLYNMFHPLCPHSLMPLNPTHTKHQMKGKTFNLVFLPAFFSFSHLFSVPILLLWGSHCKTSLAGCGAL